MSQTIDAARLTLLLNDLRLPAIKQGWAAFAERADKEGWPAARFLASLAEHEIAERDRRRIERHLVEARLLPGKTLDSFEFEVVPMVSKAHVMAICAGDSWIDKGANLILNRRTRSRFMIHTVIGAKKWASPHFSLAPARIGQILCGCAAATRPLRSEPCRA